VVAAAAKEVVFQKPMISDHLGSFEEHEDLGWLVGGRWSAVATGLRAGWQAAVITSCRGLDTVTLVVLLRSLRCASREKGLLALEHCVSCELVSSVSVVP